MDIRIVNASEFWTMIMSLQNDNFVSFTAVFAKLENLYLSGSDLTSIPSAMYQYPALKTQCVGQYCYILIVLTRWSHIVDFIAGT
uniref:Uncharacterized protein n=1 Tax=Peronospora matthiolae TaxID=2874970 RepID=A0AAV1URF0_9STRA